MMSPAPPPVPSTLVSGNENWYRLGSLVFDGILPALHFILHNDNNDSSYRGLPRDTGDLYRYFNSYGIKTKLNMLKSKKVINQTQYDLLLPASNSTDSSDFDVSLTYVLIRNFLHLPTRTGWDHSKLMRQNPMEKTIAAFVLRGKEVRNFLGHTKPMNVTAQVLQDQWDEGVAVINGLGYTGCDLNDLWNNPLDGKSFNDLQTRIKSEGIRLDKKIDDLQVEVNGLKKDKDLTDNVITTLREKINDFKKSEDLNGQIIDCLRKDIDDIKVLIKDVDAHVFQDLVRDVQVGVVEGDAVRLIVVHANAEPSTTKSSSKNLTITLLLNLKNRLRHQRLTDSDFQVGSATSNYNLCQIREYLTKNIEFGDQIRVQQKDVRVKHTFVKGTKIKFELHFFGDIPAEFDEQDSSQSIEFMKGLKETLERCIEEKCSYSVNVTYTGWWTGSLLVGILVSKTSGEKWMSSELPILNKVVQGCAVTVGEPMVLGSCCIIEDSNENSGLASDLQMTLQLIIPENGIDEHQVSESVKSFTFSEDDQLTALRMVPRSLGVREQIQVLYEYLHGKDEYRNLYKRIHGKDLSPYNEKGEKLFTITLEHAAKLILPHLTKSDKYVKDRSTSSCDKRDGKNGNLEKRLIIEPEANEAFSATGDTGVKKLTIVKSQTITTPKQVSGAEISNEIAREDKNSLLELDYSQVTREVECALEQFVQRAPALVDIDNAAHKLFMYVRGTSDQKNSIHCDNAHLDWGFLVEVSTDGNRHRVLQALLTLGHQIVGHVVFTGKGKQIIKQIKQITNECSSELTTAISKNISAVEAQSNAGEELIQSLLVAFQGVRVGMTNIKVTILEDHLSSSSFLLSAQEFLQMGQGLLTQKWCYPVQEINELAMPDYSFPESDASSLLLCESDVSIEIMEEFDRITQLNRIAFDRLLEELDEHHFSDTASSNPTKSLNNMLNWVKKAYITTLNMGKKWTIQMPSNHFKALKNEIYQMILQQNYSE